MTANLKEGKGIRKKEADAILSSMVMETWVRGILGEVIKSGQLLDTYGKLNWQGLLKDQIQIQKKRNSQGQQVLGLSNYKNKVVIK